MHQAEEQEEWGQDGGAGEQEETGDGRRETPHSIRRFSLGSFKKRLEVMGESIARAAASAGEVVLDPQLRSRSAALLAEGAGKAARGLQQGAERIAAGPRTVQGILQKLQHRIEEQRIQALLQEQQDTPVDVQVAFQLYEDAPQELRSRLWMAVLEHPELCKEYQTLATALQQQQQQEATDTVASASGRDGGEAAAAEAQQAAAAGPVARLPTPFVQFVGTKTAAVGGDGPACPAVSLVAEPPGAAEAAAAAATSYSSSHDANVVKEQQRGEVEQRAPGQDGIAGAAHIGTPDPAHLSSSYSAPWAAHHVSARGAMASPHIQPLGQRQDEDGWQMVNDQAAARRLQGQMLLAGSGEHPPYCRDRKGFRNILMTAMVSIPWPLPSEYPSDCRYATLLQISVGQEDIDEVISRDIHRTFPEYPLFAFEQGQQALFNVLKAYALHDMEAAYCQGMAFVAGLLLFYVPEEPAFQLFCRLLSTSGPNLRRLYLPGLEGLKAELRKLDFLLERFLPNLTVHLNAAGVVPVLFASQWLLTCYSCPFPVGFACRLIDVMLQENSDAILLKAAVTILAECEGDLLMQEDFEALLTYLKVEPVQWSPQRLRRVLNAAIASPITAQDLADAEAALTLGFTGSLSRMPTTFSAEEEPEGAQGEEAAGAASTWQIRHSRNTSLTSQPSTTTASLPSGGAAEAGEDAVAAELAAAQQQIDEELMDLVLRLDMDWGASGGDDAEESYSNTLHVVQAGTGSSHGQPPGG